MNDGQQRALLLGKHVGDDAVHQQVDRDIAHTADQRKHQQQPVAVIAVQGHGANGHTGHAHQHRAGQQAVQLVEPFTEQAQQHRHHDAAQGLNGHHEALAAFGDAEKGHHGLGVGAKGVEIDAVQQKQGEAQGRQQQQGTLCAAHARLLMAARAWKVSRSAGYCRR